VHIATLIRDVVCAQCLQSQIILHRMEEGGDVAGWHANPFYVPPGQLPADEAVSFLDIRWKAIEISHWAWWSSQVDISTHQICFWLYPS